MIDLQDEKQTASEEKNITNTDHAEDTVNTQEVSRQDSVEDLTEETDTSADNAAGDEAAEGAAEDTSAQEADTDADSTSDNDTDNTPDSDAEDHTDNDEDDVMDAEWSSAEEGGIRGFFKKKKDKKDIQIEELTDRVRRQMAEFDNFRKRTDKEKAASFEVGAKSVIEKILPVVDNFERGLAAAPEGDDPFAEGMSRIYKQLMTTLEAMDVKPIDAVGQEFNPDLHNAVMHVDDENVGENIVVEELQKGYTYRGSVVRYSMVKVAN